MVGGANGEESVVGSQDGVDHESVVGRKEGK